MESKNQTGIEVFSNGQNFELAQRMAKALMTSDLVPKQYQNNLPNTLIALEMANRIGATPLMVMQHLNIIQGRPSWGSSFLISAVNSCGRYEPLRYEIENEGNIDKMRCRAISKDKKSGEVLVGSWVSMQMAKDEGWLQKSGSKWKTMPELMIRYRAAAFWSRLYAPDITMGMQTAEEVIDVVYTEVKNEVLDPFAETKTVDTKVEEVIVETKIEVVETKEAPIDNKLNLK